MTPHASTPRESKPPSVSVIMTCYNGERYLAQTIESILGQTYADFEFLILDDCSNDGTVALIQRYDDPRIVLVRNTVNLGISESRNAGLRMARGTYIATTDQDDVSEPTRLEQQVSHLERHPEIAVVGTRVDLLIHGHRTQDPMPSQANPLLVHFALFFGRHNASYSTLCIRRRFITEHDLYFCKQYRYAEDYELLSRMVAIGKVAVLPEPLVSYRRHESNNSNLHYDEMCTNGLAFMTARYAHELEREVAPDEAVRMWRGLVEKRPVMSVQELRALGRVTAELTTQFARHHATDDHERQSIAVLASQVWHDIVDISVNAIGLGADRIRGEFDVLQAWSPAPVARLKTGLRGALRMTGLRSSAA